MQKSALSFRFGSQRIFVFPLQLMPLEIAKNRVKNKRMGVNYLFLYAIRSKKSSETKYQLGNTFIHEFRANIRMNFY